MNFIYTNFSSYVSQGHQMKRRLEFRGIYKDAPHPLLTLTVYSCIYQQYNDENNVLCIIVINARTK